ncbi:MAG: hypothetical protein FWD42_06400 [Solirubrobacterales bacterium]|nr:hypothetical protein [Solirubrobacterales bacterium]
MGDAPRRGPARAAATMVALLAAPAPAPAMALATTLAAPTLPAHGARLERVTDSAHLTLVHANGNTLVERGRASGGLPGPVEVWLTLRNGIASSRFTIHTTGGTLSGRGTGRLKTGNGGYDSFGGSVAVVGGTGRFRAARGRGGLYGSIYRVTDALSVVVVGELHYPAGAAGAAAGAPAVVPAGAAAAAAAAAAAVAAAAAGSPTAPRVSLDMRFRPDRLGQSTTIHWGFAVSEPEPLRALQLRLPPGMGYISSSLGLEVCEPSLLTQGGPSGCPVDSRIGAGGAVAEVPAQTDVRERANVTAFMGPAEGEDLTVLFFVDGSWPANRELVLTSHLTDISAPQGATLLTEVPQLPVWPQGPDIRLIRLSSTIGPEGVTYHRSANGRTVSFSPRGVSVPERCPRGGFPVWASFSWWNTAATSRASTRVPCPRPAR